MKLYNNILIIIILSSMNIIAQSTFSEQTIRKAILSYLQENAPQNSEFEILSEIEEVKYSQSDITATIINKSNDYSGIINLQILFKLGNKNLKFMDVKARIKRLVELPFASRNISKNSIISSDDIEYKLINESKFKNIDSNIFNIIGKRSSEFIQKGALIRSDMLESEKIINRGDKVIILSNSGAVSVRTQGTALEDGAEGETIRVSRDSFNKKILSGIVQSDGSILININSTSLGFGYEKSR